MSTDGMNFKYFSEQFADLMILRYRVPGFDELSLNLKKLIYYLYEASLSGREIIIDQNYKYNLKIKRTLEAVVNYYKGDRECKEFENFMVYVKRFWFSNGIHHHYSAKKFQPQFSDEYFSVLLKNTPLKKLPMKANESIENFIRDITSKIFDPSIASQKVNLDPGNDVIAASCNNFYENVSQKEVEEYYGRMAGNHDPEPASYGLNSKLVKENGELSEKIWCIGGMYSQALERIVYWLEKAAAIAENEIQKAALEKLIEFYKTGNLKIFDEYNIIWLKDNNSTIDIVSGFIEVYGDPLGFKGSYEGMVSLTDIDSTKRIQAISGQAQWFEDNSPIDSRFKKKNVKGISARAINVVVEAGDSSPSTPIGVNLPNSTWIREKHGSKSVNLSNIVEAYNAVDSEKILSEFAFSDEEVELNKKYGVISDNLHTDLHEVIGHGSGQILEGIAPPHQTLKNYSSTIEETRADLVALYYLADKKLEEIGVIPCFDAVKAGYNKYLRNGLMIQLARIQPGEKIEESHMRNRQLICMWAFEKGTPGKIIEKINRDKKTYFVIRDYTKLRTLFGELLCEVQRITSEGDYDAAKNLVETYGVKVDWELHAEIKLRYDKLNIPPYKGFINPILRPVFENGDISNVIIEYPVDFTGQMLYYSDKYSFLPIEN